jgi:hypothetical protein
LREAVFLEVKDETGVIRFNDSQFQVLTWRR